MDDRESIAAIGGDATEDENIIPLWWVTSDDEMEADMAAVASPDAERALVGNALAYPDILDQAMADVTADMFTVDAYRVLWRILTQMRQKNAPIDLITVQQTAERLGWGDRLGNLADIMDIAEAAMDYQWWPAYAGIIVEKARMRRVQQAARTALEAIQGRRQSAAQIAAGLMQQLETALGRSRKTYRPLGDWVDQVLTTMQDTAARGGGITGTPTGHQALDQVTLGWQPADLIILAARPSMGKTTLALNWARNAAIEGGRPVGMFSLEMSGPSVAAKFLAMESGVSLQHIRAATLDDAEWYTLSLGVGALKDAAIFIDDTPGLSVAEFRARALEMKRREDIGLIVVDYLQLMEYRGLENRVQEISGISRTLKQVARELHIPVIALSQLSRDVEKREDKRPMMSDLRDSGSIEQDADVILFIYRDAYYHRETPTEADPMRDATEVIVAKHRNGPTGTAFLRFDKDTGRFIDTGRWEAN